MNFIKSRYCCFLLAILFSSQAVQAMDGEEDNKLIAPICSQQESKTEEEKALEDYNIRRAVKYYNTWKKKQNKNFEEAYKALTKSATRHYPPALHEIALLCLEKADVLFGSQKIGYQKSIEYINQLAAHDSAAADFLRGFVCLQRITDSRDIDRGLNLYLNASKKGNADAAYILAQHYERGVQIVDAENNLNWYLKPNLMCAIEFYEKATQDRHPQAQQALQSLESRCHPVSQELSQNPPNEQKKVHKKKRTKERSTAPRSPRETQEISQNRRREKKKSHKTKRPKERSTSPRSPRETHTTTDHNSPRKPTIDKKTRKKNK